MNIFWRELRFYSKGLVFWCLGMVILIWTSMIKYSTFSAAGQSMTELLAQFPKTIQTIFGMTGFDLSKVSGFYGVMFMYLALMATIHAAMLGSGIIAKEERDRTSEFIFVKPVTRGKVITAKIMAGILSMLVFNIVTLLSSIFFIYVYSHDVSFVGDIVNLMLGLLCLQMIFFFVGTTTAAISRRPKLSASIASAILLFAFILTYLINFNSDFDLLKYLTPFKYFDAKDILGSGHLDWAYLAITFGLISTMVVVTYTTYTARDLDV
ncbi:ABC transporter permease subunit [Candidatus Saccharibacteria bacterium]|nr:ABC transporter permease subunit [Candidatus Saccharibacteria bacterium]